MTADGIFWYPVTADDEGLRVDTELFPLVPRTERVRELFRQNG